MNRNLIRQLLRYGVIGVLALGMDVGTFSLMRSMDVGLVPSNVIARFAGAVAAYGGNHLWTFSNPTKTKDWLRSSWRYVILWFAATIVSTLLIDALIRLDFNEMRSKVGVEMLMPVLNFLIARHWVFR